MDLKNIDAGRSEMPETCQESTMPQTTKTIADFVGDYLLYCSAERGLAEGTISCTKKILDAFTVFFNSRGIKVFGEVNRPLIREYLSETLAYAPSNDFKYRIISTLRTFGRFLGREGAWDDYHLLVQVESPKRCHKLPEVLSEEEVARIIEQPLKALIRDWALLEALYSTGCRVGEIANLRYRDVKLGAGSAVVQGKGKKDRIVFLNDRAKAAIVLLRSVIYSTKPDPDDFVFPASTNPARAMSKSQIGMILKKHAGTAEIIKRVYPHILRHSFATHLLNNGANIMEIKEMLGHAAINNTQIYTHVAQEKVKKDYNRLFGGREHNQSYWITQSRRLAKYLRIINYSFKAISQNPLFSEGDYREISQKVGHLKSSVNQL